MHCSVTHGPIKKTDVDTQFAVRVMCCTLLRFLTMRTMILACILSLTMRRRVDELILDRVVEDLSDTHIKTK